MNSEETQKLHFDDKAAEYSLHYDDDDSSIYRQKFFYTKMFSGINCTSKNVLDAMCGSGHMSAYFLQKNCTVSALDISQEFTTSLKKRFPSIQVETGSIFKTPYSNNSFDIITILGGLHHLHPHIENGLQEINRILKPGGYFIAIEPPSGTLVDIIRKFWYKRDNYFAENEQSVNLQWLAQSLKPSFSKIEFSFGGGPAYYLIFNSLITRMPIWLKKILAHPMMALDSIIEIFLPRMLSAYVVIRAKKNGELT